MIEKFKQYIATEELFDPEKDTILLTVSGGIDSVVLCELFYQSKYKFAIAHCNFHLRGEDSNEDELFVMKLAEHYNVPFYCQHFDAKGYAEEQGISIQMAARDLRYEWFKKMLEDHPYSYAATGHHRDDNIETFFINLLRGTGIRGLRGMLPKQSRFIHPLLFTNRLEIIEFYKENALSYREDITNSETKYERNQIRHELIPYLRGISPIFDVNMSKNIERFRETESVLQELISEARREVLSQQGKIFFISIPALEKFRPVKFYLFEILYEFGFNPSVVENIVQSFHSISGKRFFSHKYQLIKDREQLIIVPIKPKPNKLKAYRIRKEDTLLEFPFRMSIKVMNNHSGFIFKKDKHIAYFDYDKLEFPLRLRNWRNGDYFFPLGMKGKKKLSNLFTDLKLSLWQKENFYLLCSGKRIVWAVGERIDNRFKVNENTKRILKITLLD